MKKRMTSTRKILTSLLLCVILLVTGCTSAPPSRFEDAQQQSSSKEATAVVNESVTGGSLNRYFPAEGGGYTRVYTQEKKGFAQAKLQKNGAEVAVMSISDTLNNPTAKNKFAQATKTISGYPAVEQGSNSTAVLVDDRFQVKVSSRNDSFSETDRADWLSKFDLAGLEQFN